MRSKFGKLYWNMMQKTWGSVVDFMLKNKAKFPRFLFCIYEIINIVIYVLSAIIIRYVAMI